VGGGGGSAKLNIALVSLALWTPIFVFKWTILKITSNAIGFCKIKIKFG
jgi:hypothetical protein